MSSSQLDIFGGDDVSSIIIDLGSHTTRVGYGQEDSPRQCWNSICGRSLDNTDDNESQKYEFPLDLYSPCESVEVMPCVYAQGARFTIDPVIFEHIISETVEGHSNNNRSHKSTNLKSVEKNFGGLGVNIKDHPFLLSEPSKHSNQVREIMCEVMFDLFQVPALYLAKQAMLSAFSMGRSSGLVTDIGALGMTISPVTDGYVLQKNIVYFSAGGNLLDWHIYHSITNDIQSQIIPFYGKKIVRHHSTSHINTFNSPWYDLSRIHSSFLHYSQLKAIQNLKESVCKVYPKSQIKDSQLGSQNISSNIEISLNDFSSDSNFFELPDGLIINVKRYQYDIGEFLFRPEPIKSKHSDPYLKNFEGLPNAILQTILNCDVDLRKELLNNIILTGGTSSLPGLIDRVNQELHQSDPLINNSMKFKIVAPSSSVDRSFGVWLGGSILSSLGTFQQLWVSKQEYEEHGPRIINRRCN